MKTNTPCTGVRSTWWLCDVHIKMNAHHDIVWEHNFLKIAMWRAVFLPPSCYQGTLSTTTGLIRWYQSLPRTCKGCKGHVWEARSWPERPPSQVVDAPFTSFPPDRLLHFLKPLVAPFSSWRVYLFRTLALRALCPPRSLLYHSLSHLISLLLRFSPSLLQAKEILMQHRPMSKEGAITQKNKLNNMNNNNNTEGVFDASLHGPLFANKTCHCLNLNRGD